MNRTILHACAGLAAVLGGSACTEPVDEGGDPGDAETIGEAEGALSLFSRRIQNVGGGQCLYAVYDAGTVVTAGACTALLRWNIDDQPAGSDNHLIRWAGITQTGNRSRCLTLVGSTLMVYRCGDEPSRVWHIVAPPGYVDQYKICQEGFCLTTVAGSSTIELRPYDGSPRQRWMFPP